MPKWLSLTAALLFILAVGGGAVGYLTFTSANQFRERWLWKESFAEAKREGQKAVDDFFFGKEEKAKKRRYAELPENLKQAYAAAVAQGDEGIQSFLEAQVMPPWYLPYLNMLGLIALGVGLGYLCRPLFLKFNGRLVFSVILTGILGGWFAHLSVNGIFPMGIDLAGGTELIYRLDFKSVERRVAEAQALLNEKRVEQKEGKATEDDVRRLESDLQALISSRDGAHEKAADVVRKRVDPTGTKGIPITSYDEGRRLRIQLPKATPEEVERIKRAIMTQGRLTFHLCADDTRDSEIIHKVKDPENALHEYKGYELIKVERKDPYDPKNITYHDEVIQKTPMLEGSRVVFAGFSRNQEGGGWQVNLRFDASGSARFEKVTGENKGRRMAIVLDGHCTSAPTIQERIAGECRISGNFTKKEAQELAGILTAGSLPAEVKEESEFTVGPALGHAQIESGFEATLVSAILVALFMWLYYRFGGFVTVLCLGLNLLIMMGALGFFKATMTLPGIAGIALSLGMAVDANVLIFERIREEQARGRPLRLAVQMGFERALSAIIDSNLTTLLTGLIMYYIGTGPVRGFAVTLCIGILVTLLANLWIFRNVMEWLVSREAVPQLKMQKLLPETKIDFMGMRKPWYFISGGLCALALVLFVKQGVLSDKIYDLDFTGGTLVQINFAEGEGSPDESIKETMSKQFEPKLKERLAKIAERLEQLASAPTADDATATRNAITKDLPEVARAQLTLTAKVGKEELTEMAAIARTNVQEFDRLRLTTQSFGEPDEKGNYHSFTLTTRNIEALVNETIVSQILDVYAGKVEPYAVSVEGDSIRVQMTPKAGDPTGGVKAIDLKAEVLSAIRTAAADKSYAALKTDLEALKVGDPVSLGKPGRYTIDVTGLPADSMTRELLRVAIEETHIKHQAEGPVGRKCSFGQAVSGEMRATAVMALLASLIGIFIYLWFRFEFSGAWGAGAILALFHDVLVALGAVCFVNWLDIYPILLDLNMVAALLTVMGYSVNDTIVIYDRIREVKSAHPTRSLDEVVNEAVNQTLSRTVLTWWTTMLAVLALFFLGGPTIRDITFPLLVGMVAGIYSSVFVASPLMVWWYRRFGATFSTQPQTGQSTPTGAQI